MEQELYIDGLSISKEVVETIVSLSANKVEGVVSVGESFIASGVNKLLGSRQKDSSGVEVSVVDGKLNFAVRLTVFYGYSLCDLAKDVRLAIADAIKAQVGVEVGLIDVYIDHLIIPKDER